MTVDLNKVAEKVQDFVKEVKAEGGNKKRIDTQRECDKLAEYLANNERVMNIHEKNFIEGFMIEFKKTKREKEVDESVSKDTKKLVKTIAKETGNKKTIDSDTEAQMLLDLLKNTKNDLNSAEIEYIKNILRESGYGSLLEDNAKQKEDPAVKEHVEKNPTKDDTNPAEEKYSEPVEDHKKEDENLNKNSGNIPNNQKKIPTPRIVPLPVFVPTPTSVENNMNSGNRVDNSQKARQNGQVNVNGNNNTVNNIYYYGIPQTEEDKGADGVAPKDTHPEKDSELSPEDVKKSRENGYKVADKLFGYTSNSEQADIQQILNEEMNSQNVIEILKGYEKRFQEFKNPILITPVGPHPNAAELQKDHFFEQMRTETDFPEKQKLMRKVAEDLQAYFQNKYGVDSAVAKEISVILLEEKLGKEQAELLDLYYKNEVRKAS